MLAVLKRLLQHGIGTLPKHQLEHFTGRGKVLFEETKCTACGACVSECPTSALSLHSGDVASPGSISMTIFYGACISCGVCTDVCEEGAFSMTSQPIPSARDKQQLTERYLIAMSQTRPAETGESLERY